MTVRRSFTVLGFGWNLAIITFGLQNDKTIHKTVRAEIQPPSHTPRALIFVRQGYTLPGLTRHSCFFSQASRNYSIHPLGVFYNKANEGAQYQDGTTGNDTADNAIMPNETYLYKWIVPDAVAPTENDPSCLTWMYHSNVDSTKDTHSGKVTIPLVAML